MTTFISFLLGGLASFLATLVAERLKRPKLVAEILSHDVIYDPPRQAKTARYLQVRITNQELPRGLRWLGRNAAMFCSGKINFRKESGEAVFQTGMPLRWSGTPEPIPMQIEIGGVTGKIVDHYRAHLEQRVDIPTGESRKFDVAAQFDGEEECYGWSNEAYIPVVEWRNARRRLAPGVYHVEATILHLGGRLSYSCLLSNQKKDPHLQTNT